MNHQESKRDVDRAIEDHSKALWDLLSPVARRAEYPRDVPFQAAEARGTRYNATIGQLTDGHGRVLGLPTVEETLSSLSSNERNRALLYSPIGGFPALREAWRARELGGRDLESSLPIVTVGLTHALALAADLFGGPGRPVLVPDPCWGNYEQVFGLRTGAELISVPAFAERRFQPESFAIALDALPDRQPAVVILNFPANPVGYMPTREERGQLASALADAATRRPVVVVCDDAYQGLVFDADVPRESLYLELLGRHPSLFPVRVSGATKELVFFGGRVGFLSLPFSPTSEVWRALENKLLCLLRAGVGSPSALSQVVMLRALGAESLDREIESVRSTLEARHKKLVLALAEVDDDVLRLMPSNAGAFALIEVPPGIDPDRLRHHLIEHQDTGVVSVAPCYLRLAFCSVDLDDIGALVARLEVGVRAVAP